MENYFAIGKIVRPHGIKGGVKVLPFNEIDFPFSKLKKVYVGQKFEKASVVGLTKLNNAFVFFLDIIADTNHAESFRNFNIYVNKKDYEELFDNLFVPSDLVGAILQDNNGENLGVIVDVNKFGSAPIMTVNCVGCSYDIPYVDSFTKFDKVKNVVVMNKKTFEDLRV